MEIVIVDDDVVLAEGLREKVCGILKGKGTLRLFSEQYENVLKIPHIDLVFMDIQLKNENGIDLYEKIREKFPQSQVIFMSSYPHYGQDIFESSPSYFLIKPIVLERLEKALRKVMEIKAVEEKNFVYQFKDMKVSLKESEIIYFQSDKRKILVYTQSQCSEFYGKLNELEINLGKQFCRCHQSYLLNLDWVKYLEAKEFVLKNKEIIPISRTKYQKVKEDFIRYMGEI